MVLKRGYSSGLIEGKDVIYVYGGPAGISTSSKPVAQDLTNRILTTIPVAEYTLDVANEAATAMPTNGLSLTVLDPVAVKFVPQT